MPNIRFTALDFPEGVLPDPLPTEYGYVNPTWPRGDGQEWTHLARDLRHERAR